MMQTWNMREKWVKIGTIRFIHLFLCCVEEKINFDQQLFLVTYIIAWFNDKRFSIFRNGLPVKVVDGFSPALCVHKL